MDFNKISTDLELDINTGTQSKLYTVIIRYSGNLQAISASYNLSFIFLLNGFAITRISKEIILFLTDIPEILYIEPTRKLVYEEAVSAADRALSCFPVAANTFGADEYLSGKGICTAIIDSGLDILHPAFSDDNGYSRILTYWDQNQVGNPPEGYFFGTEYSNTDIQNMIDSDSDVTNYPYDGSGHGTAVASIVSTLAGQTMLIGVATKPDTAAFLCAIDYAVRFSQKISCPLVVNLSYGNNYGDHLGNSMMEQYIDLLQNAGKITVVTGMGNDGNTGRHKYIYSNKETISRIFVENGLLAFNLQLWADYNIQYLFYFIAPNGQRSPVIPANEQVRTHLFDLYNTSVSIQLGTVSPYSTRYEVFISFLAPQNTNGIPGGSWQIVFLPVQNQFFSIHAWLPVAASTTANVFFETPTEELSLTIPASSQYAISVGAYDSRLLTVTPFSGRGLANPQILKPDLVAPGVRIRTATPGGRYTLSSGTSFATPFVSAAAALLMQWGIIDNNDPFLYGARIKSYLRAGAFVLPGTDRTPNNESGYGALCAQTSLP